MAQADRKFGSDITVWEMGDQATPTDFVGMLAAASVTPEMDTKENKALKDEWKYPKAGIKGWKSENTFAVDDDLATLWLELNNTAVWCQLSTGGTGATRYTGTGILTAWTHDIPDGGQTVKVTITGQGELVVDTVPA